MPEKQIKYVAVDPEGNVKPPFFEDPEVIKKALIAGYAPAKVVWLAMKRMGYTIRKAEIILLEEDGK